MLIFTLFSFYIIYKLMKFSLKSWLPIIFIFLFLITLVTSAKSLLKNKAELSQKILLKKQYEIYPA